MRIIPNKLAVLIDELKKLPTIGSRSAMRLAFHLLRRGHLSNQNLSLALTEINKSLQYCQTCFYVSEDDTCSICREELRNKQQICVVEEPIDLVAIESTMEYNGTYHILHGALSPVDGVTSDKLKVQELLARIQTAPEKVEIILATNTSLEGESTAMYIYSLLKDSDKVTITRLASGLPFGAQLEYSDELTLAKAMSERKPFG